MFLTIVVDPALTSDLGVVVNDTNFVFAYSRQGECRKSREGSDGQTGWHHACSAIMSVTPPTSGPPGPSRLMMSPERTDQTTYIWEVKVHHSQGDTEQIRVAALGRGLGARRSK